MIAWQPSHDPTDALPASYASYLDRHLKTLLASQSEPVVQAPLVALAYWGAHHVISDIALAERLQHALDELTELPHGTLETLLRRSLPRLNLNLHETAKWVLDWLIEYLYLND